MPPPPVAESDPGEYSPPSEINSFESDVESKDGQSEAVETMRTPEPPTPAPPVAPTRRWGQRQTSSSSRPVVEPAIVQSDEKMASSAPLLANHAESIKPVESEISDAAGEAESFDVPADEVEPAGSPTPSLVPFPEELLEFAAKQPKAVDEVKIAIDQAEAPDGSVDREESQVPGFTEPDLAEPLSPDLLPPIAGTTNQPSVADKQEVEVSEANETPGSLGEDKPSEDLSDGQGPTEDSSVYRPTHAHTLDIEKFGLGVSAETSIGADEGLDNGALTSMAFDEEKRQHLSSEDQSEPLHDANGPGSLEGLPSEDLSPSDDSNDELITTDSGDVHWIDELIASDVFVAQRSLRRKVSEAKMETALKALDRNQGLMSHDELAELLGMSPGRVRGLVATMSTLLNLDGYPVIADDGERIKFDRTLARQQFGIT